MLGGDQNYELKQLSVTGLIKTFDSIISDDNDTLKRPLRKSSSLKKQKYNVHNNHKAYLEHQPHPGQIRMRRRQNNSKCFHYMTGVLHCYNVFLLIIGAGVLGLGVWLHVKDYSAREITAIVNSHYFELMTHALTAGGGAVAILAFCGCCGTMKKDKFVLGFYGTVLVLVLLLLIGGCVVGMVFRHTVSSGLLALWCVVGMVFRHTVSSGLVALCQCYLLEDAWQEWYLNTQGCLVGMVFRHTVSSAWIGSVMLVLLIRGCVVGMVFRHTLDEGIKGFFKKTVERQYGVDINRNADNRLVTDAWDAMQRTLQCCGPYGGPDSVTSWAFYKLSSDWHKRPGASSFPYVPKSCCIDGMSVIDCQGIKNLYKGYPVYGPPLRSGEDRNPALNKVGCFDKAVEYLRKHSLYISITAGVVPVVLIIGVCISCYLCLTVKSGDDDDDDDEFEEADIIGVCISCYLCLTVKSGDDDDDDDEFEEADV
ncbi:hypothetical protein FSP39_002057 [Pinctada imbricata]|uniref:Tetraspanin n=1 Tax=Pinctada imbricata TaxID=66713 RepID=A0AA88XPF2_PINIB|nr:hypothetical protein FSP39_002057 [Pinctada imbricata]